MLFLFCLSPLLFLLIKGYMRMFCGVWGPNQIIWFHSLWSHVSVKTNKQTNNCFHDVRCVTSVNFLWLDCHHTSPDYWHACPLDTIFSFFFFCTSLRERVAEKRDGISFLYKMLSFMPSLMTSMLFSVLNSIRSCSWVKA